MDPVTLGAVLVALATGVGGALGGQLWTGLGSLIRGPLHQKAAVGDAAAVVSGQTELAVLQQSPGDQRTAVALAEALLARAGADAGFANELEQWWAQAEPVRVALGNVTNTISGGTFNGPVLQGRDFTGPLTFGVAPASPAAMPKDPGAG
jgi:hypothetical protein